METDGDYVYFITEPQKDYVNVDKPIYYKLGRISFDGKQLNQLTVSRLLHIQLITDGFIILITVMWEMKMILV